MHRRDMKSTDKVSFINNWDFSLNLKTMVGKDKQALIKFYYNEEKDVQPLLVWHSSIVG
jgi:hypothetical protein